MRCRLVALTCLATLSCTRTPGQHELPIVGGEPEPGWPGVLVAYNVSSRNQCTGTAIAPRVVVTAKHCTVGTNTADWRVLVGAEPLLLEGRDAEYRVTEVRASPGDNTVGEDVALLLLEEDFAYERYAWAATLPAGFGDGSTVTLRSYGRTDAADPSSFGRKYRRGGTVYDLQATVFSADVGACSGDSGGPAFDDSGTVVGVVSQGDGSCSGVSTFDRVDAAAAMIAQAIQDTGGSGDGDADADADADGDTDADGDGDADTGGDGDGDGPPSSGGCSCRLVP